MEPGVDPGGTGVVVPSYGRRGSGAFWHGHRRKLARSSPNRPTTLAHAVDGVVTLARARLLPADDDDRIKQLKREVFLDEIWADAWMRTLSSAAPRSTRGHGRSLVADRIRSDRSLGVSSHQASRLPAGLVPHSPIRSSPGAVPSVNRARASSAGMRVSIPSLAVQSRRRNG